MRGSEMNHHSSYFALITIATSAIGFSFAPLANSAPAYFTETEMFLNSGSGSPIAGSYDSGQQQQTVTSNSVSGTSTGGQPISSSSISDLSVQKVGAGVSTGNIANKSTASSTATLLDTFIFSPLSSEAVVSYSIRLEGSIVDRLTGLPASPPSSFYAGGSLVWGFGTDASAIATDADRLNPNYTLTGNLSPLQSGALDLAGGEVSIMSLFDGTIDTDGNTTINGTLNLAAGSTELALYLSLGLGTANNNYTVDFLNSADFSLVFPEELQVTRASGLPVNNVPIPAAAWLFGSGLLGLGFIKRKRS